jgi:tRNase Z endonuclease
VDRRKFSRPSIDVKELRFSSTTLALRSPLRGIFSRLAPSKSRAAPKPRSAQQMASDSTQKSHPKTHIQFQKLHVVNTFSSDTGSPSLMISTQYRTYIFNCGEGMQRLLQSTTRLPKYSDIFLTRLNWDVTGGLPGPTIFRIQSHSCRIFVDDLRVDRFQDSDPWSQKYSPFPCHFSELHL